MNSVHLVTQEKKTSQNGSKMGRVHRVHCPRPARTPRPHAQAARPAPRPRACHPANPAPHAPRAPALAAARAPRVPAVSARLPARLLLPPAYARSPSTCARPAPYAPTCSLPPACAPHARQPVRPRQLPCLSTQPRAQRLPALALRPARLAQRPATLYCETLRSPTIQSSPQHLSHNTKSVSRHTWEVAQNSIFLHKFFFFIIIKNFFSIYFQKLEKSIKSQKSFFSIFHNT